jgi:hypothetical protein
MSVAVPVFAPLALVLLFMCALNLLSGLQRVARQGAIPVIPTRSIAAASHGPPVSMTTLTSMHTCKMVTASDHKAFDLA